MEEQMKRMTAAALHRVKQFKAKKKDPSAPGAPPAYSHAMPVKEARMLLVQLSELSKDGELTQYLLHSWLSARMYVQKVDVNLQLSGASWVIGGLLLVVVGCSIAFLIGLISS